MPNETCRFCHEPIHWDDEAYAWCDTKALPDACGVSIDGHEPEPPLDTPPDLSDVEAIENWLESGA